MRIWLVTIGEPLPADGEATRLLRTGLLATQLAERGHEVLWWTSAFDHNRKMQRVTRDTTIRCAPNVTIKMLRSPIAYRKNISLARLANHYHLAWKFGRLAQREQPPNLILSSLPTVELSLQAVRYGKARKIPVVLDARDMWPDLLIDAIPRALRPLARPAIVHLRHAMQQACANASAIVGITPEFVDWALAYAHRPRGKFDADFPLADDPTATRLPPQADAMRFWAQRGLAPAPERFIVCFFGNVGSAGKYEWQHIADAAEELERRNLPIRFVICGAGDGMPAVERLTAGRRNIIFCDWINAQQIASLMSFSQAGLIPYRNRPDFAASLPNKAIEYLSAGLPVVSSLEGALGRLLSDENAGLVFRSGKELARVLADLHGDRRRLELLSRNARRLYDNRFESKSVYRRFAAHLESVALD